MRHAARRLILCITVMLLVICSIGCSGTTTPKESTTSSNDGWTQEFGIVDRKLTDSGESTYFILKPGYQIVLASSNAVLGITVLDETKTVNGIVTRIVEEREEEKGELIEISRNFFAMDQATGDVFYFGEDVDMYSKGKVASHSGAWLAYEKGNKPGLIMPGKPEVGMKYYQEVAPGIAMDRARVVSISETCKTPAGEFKNCLQTEESSPIESGTEYKYYAPGIGMIQDESLKLTKYGYIALPTSPK